MDCDRRLMQYSVLNALIVGRVSPALAEERAPTTAAGQVVPKLKTPWRDGITHTGMLPLESMGRLVCGLPCPELGATRL